ncbi:MAG: TPM domain-containing protein [Oligoflexia bacterium]|nr:TPM domain-containing protein [Oligoflexia bacterium]
MAIGKKAQTRKFSPIIEAIARAETGTTGEIRVHLTRSWIEKDAFAHAWSIFNRFAMFRTAQRNAVLLYVNLRKHKFAIVGDEGIHKAVGQRYWERVARNLSRNMGSTHYENAIALAVREIGEVLHQHFPTEVGGTNHNELSDEVSED